ncbi:hypothetical protein [Neptunomonas phycophila]|uniref:hypothetical protein n=1 Tax=Neptunomonas phycophila TaxID=1572645 RepID=UPI0030F5C538
MNIVLNVTETERWSVLTQCIDGELCLAEEIESEKGNGTYVVKDTCPLPLVEKLLSEKRPNKIVIFYQQAEYYLAESIRCKVPLAVSSKKWVLIIDKLLRLQRKNRSSLVLINIEQALSDPDGFKKLLNELHIKISVENKSVINVDDFSLLVACQFVVQTTELAQINNLIQVSGQLINTSLSITIDLECFIHTNRELLEKYELACLHNNELKTENVELKNKLCKVEKNEKKVIKEKEQLLSELERNSVDSVDKEKEIFDLKQNFIKLDKKNIELGIDCNKLNVLIKESEEEKRLLFAQLNHVQEEIESCFNREKDAIFKIKKYEREIAKLEHKLRNTNADLASKNYRLDCLMNDITNMKRSVFWRTGAPVRAVSNVISKSKTQEQKIQKDIELILSSEFFDTEWYMNKYPDVAESTISPAEHYLRFGAQEGRFPSPLFSGDWYLKTYPDVAKSGINPLLHYIKFGKAEGRTASVKLLQDLSGKVVYE